MEIGVFVVFVGEQYQFVVDVGIQFFDCCQGGVDVGGFGIVVVVYVLLFVYLLVVMSQVGKCFQCVEYGVEWQVDCMVQCQCGECVGIVVGVMDFQFVNWQQFVELECQLFLVVFFDQVESFEVWFVQVE